MNKILVSKNKITSDYDNILINGNTITFSTAGDYFIEYTANSKNNLRFIINSHVKLFESSFDIELDNHNKYIIDGGSLEVIKFYNNENVNEIIDIDLCQEKDQIDYTFVNICRKEERYTININHKCKNTISNIFNKSIAFKNSLVNFIINSNVYKECIKCKLNQNTRIVTMDECDAKVCPNMFIDLDDVEAKHGSVIGSFKEDNIFYLMSKGINYNDTIKLLVSGYIISGIGKNHYLRQKITDIIDMYWR